MTLKDGSFANESVRRNDSVTQENWPDSTFRFSLVRSFVLTDESLCFSLFSYQSGEEESEPVNRTLSPGHGHQSLANEKQASTATVSMKNKHLILFVAHRSHSVSHPWLTFKLMSRWIYTLSTVVLSNSTTNHEVTALYQCYVDR